MVLVAEKLEFLNGWCYGDSLTRFGNYFEWAIEWEADCKDI